MTSKIAVAVSGGVDSLVAAYLLVQEGYSVEGIHFLTGFEPAGSRWTSGDLASHPINVIGEQLGIPVTLVDCRREFQSRVVDYFVRTYAQGRTPNPCAVCNPRIKFGVVLEKANLAGAGLLATGHYARIEKTAGSVCRLYRGADAHKDQSYFLARLSQRQLQQAAFPLGGLTKSTVKALAREKGLSPAVDSESQDVCFIKADSYADFLESQPGFEARPGPIEDLDGNVIGEHQGLHRFTVGQRRGISCPAASPYYVVRVDSSDNRLIVGTKADGLSDHCLVKKVNWIVNEPSLPKRVHVRVRYRHREVPASISRHEPKVVRIDFETPQPAVTPGQAAVFYDGDEVLGGGFIDAEGV
jgi:tRNA-specific 2-thiouridylase